MDARFPRARPAAEGQVPEGVEDVDAESKVELKGIPESSIYVYIYCSSWESWTKLEASVESLLALAI